MKLRLIASMFAAALLLGWSSAASAWGDTGHRTVCEIAMRNLTPAAAAQVTQLLGANPTIRGANPNYAELGWACTYPDHSPDGAPPQLGRRSALHFANYPRTLLAVGATSGCGVAASCVVSAIPAEVAILRSAAASPADRAAALVYLGHWLGDIHQPLHSSFEDDRGGNQVNASALCTSSLHSAWDTCIFENRSRLGRGATVDAVRTFAATLSEAVTDPQRAEWLSSDPWHWSAESYAIALRPDIGYCVMVQQACAYSASQPSFAGQRRSVRIDDSYMDRSWPLIRERVARAGIRLAHELNLALDPAYRS
jgi:hypothetical protein